MASSSYPRRSVRLLIYITLCALFAVAFLFDQPLQMHESRAVIRTIARYTFHTPANRPLVENAEGHFDLTPISLEGGGGSSTSTQSMEYDVALEAQVEEQCGFWRSEFDRWKAKFVAHSKSRDTKPLEALQRRSGTGDRLSGLLTAMSFAMADGAQLKIFWKNLDAVFVVSDYSAVNETNLVQLVDGSGGPPLASSCRSASYYSCSRLEHEQDNCPVYNRACMTTSRCKRMTAYLSALPTMAQVVGCPLKLQLRFSRELLDFQATWFLDGAERNLTVREMDGILQQYNTVSIHARLGDLAFKGTRKVSSVFKHKLVSCAKTADKFIVSQKNTLRDSKWFVASDDPALKEAFRVSHPKKVIQLLHKPRHLITLKRLKSKGAEREELLLLFAEWYLLGRSKELVTNYAHDAFGPSSFSRSAWLYNLKHEAFIVEDKVAACKHRSFQYRGNLQLIPKQCRHP